MNISNVTFLGGLIKFSDIIKYHGVTMSFDMCFSEHCHISAKSAHQMVDAFLTKVQ